MTVDVVVVGGGIAGLATAYELSRRGIRFVILEHATRVGGVILSEEVDGFAIDGGPDALLIQKPEGIALCQEIGLADRLVTTKLPRLAFVQRGGRLHPLPAASVLGIPTRVGPFVRTKLFTWPGKLRMGAELFVPRRTDRADESIGSFMRRRFGREATDFLAEPLLAGIHAGAVDRLSLHALFPRFVEAERKHGSLLRAFRTMNRAPRTTNEGAFKSLPGGLSEMIRALVRVIGDANVRTGTKVTSLTGPGPFTVRTAGAETYHARAVVIATPAYVTADLFEECDADIARRCRDIPYASAVTVALAFRRGAVAHPLNGSGFVVPRAEKTGILAASWLSSKWPGRAPEGYALMRTFLGGARDPWAIDESDVECVERSMDALRPVLGISGEPVFTRVYRWDRANAQHEVGHLARIAAIDAALARHPGLFVTGSGFRGVGIPDCVADGRKTAAQVDDLLKKQDMVTETTEIRRSSR
jgi:oxygen-dependent protoporphyrinogen oxidase